MKLAIILMLGVNLQVSANGFAQNVTLTAKDAPLKKVFREINRQTGFTFFLEDDLPADQDKVTIKITNLPLSAALDLCLKDKPLEYSIYNNTIIVERRHTDAATAQVVIAPVLVQGKVTDENGAPLAGATVKLKGTNTAVVSDAQGVFTIKTPSESGKLVITYVGYEPQELAFGNGRVLRIVMKAAAAKGDDVVIVGYTQQKKELLTGSISNVNVTQGMNELPVVSAADLLAGRVPGVNVGSATGEPGNQGGITIRTGSSWNSQPVLYVIDGMVRDAGTFQNLSANEIETISVLKDAASAAIYGVRSAGGVVVVTTKRGKAGVPTVNYTFSRNGDYATQQVPLSNLYQAGLMTNEMYSNQNSIDPRVPAAAPQGVGWSPQELSWAQSLPGQGYNGLKAVWNTPTITTNSIGISGGREGIRYFAGASYYDQKGFLASTDYKRWNLRMNVTADITPNLQLYTGFSMATTYKAGAPIEGTDATYTKLRASFNYFPTYSNQGDRYLTTGWAYGNASAEANGLIGYQHTNYIDPQAVISLTYHLPWVQGLSVKASYMADWANTHYKEFDAHSTFWLPIFSGANNHIVDANDADLTTKFTNTNFWGLYSTASWQTNHQLNLQTSYSRDFGKHHVDAAVVFEQAQSTYSSMYNQNQGFPVYQTDQYWATNNDHNDMWSGGGPDYSTGRASYIGQVNYTYSEKYLLNASLREDGSMYFAPSERWGFFPAASAGWVVSKESFLADNKIISKLKLRASVGLTGNDAVVSGWQWQQSYASGSSYYFGSTPGTRVGIRYGSLVNPNLTWEKSLSNDFGADFEIVKHLAGSFDYWNKHTYDILGARQNSLPTTFSLTMPQENYGIVDAHGVDLSIGWHDRIRSVNWFAVLNASYGTNKVIKKDYPVSYLPWQVPVGKTTNYVAGYNSYIIRTAAQLSAFQAANPNYINPGNGNSAIGLGSMVYVDRSGQKGTPDGNINSYDETVLYANPNPVVYGLDLGANWKNFSFEAVFNGYMHNPKNYFELADYYEGQMFNTRWMTQAYTAANPNAPLPMFVPREYRSYSVSNSSYWYKDASFIRLKNLNVGYTLHFKRAMGNAVKSIRFFSSATNLFYISKFKYWDPELNPGWSGIGYPIMKTFSGGVNVNF